jgi:folate-binding protein YgfZ
MDINGALQSGRLAHLGLIRIKGPDAQSFLQGQVSNDTRRLAEGRAVLCAYSNPQGRVLAVLRLLPHSSGVLAVLPRELVAPTLERLRKFVLRAKVQLEDVSEEFAVVGEQAPAGGHAPAGDFKSATLTSAGLDVPAETGGYAERGGIGVARVAHDGNRCCVVGPAAHLSERGLAGDSLAARQIDTDWRLADIRAGLPQVYAATSELFVAQMLNLDLLDGISFTKGCYTGQEIIARTQHLGRIKRRMHRLALPAGSWNLGQALRLPDGRAGRLTELAQIGEQFESLAVLTRSEHAETDSAGAAQLAPVAATELPLPYAVTYS